MFRYKILGAFSYFCLIGSSSNADDLVTNTSGQFESLFEYCFYSQVFDEQNSIGQRPGSEKRKFSDFFCNDDPETIEDFTKNLRENIPAIQFENRTCNDDFSNISDGCNPLIYSNDKQDIVKDQPVSFSNLNDNCFHPSTSSANNVCSIEQFEENNHLNSFSDYTISISSYQDPLLNLQSSVTLANPSNNFISPAGICDEVFINSSDLNQTNNNSITIEEIKKIESLKIYSDLREFIAKLIYSRKDLYEFVDICLKEDDQSECLEDKEVCFHVENEDYKSLFPLDSNNRKTNDRNLMLLIYLCIDYARKNEMHSEVTREHNKLASRISQLKKRLSQINEKLENKELSKLKHLKLKQELQTKTKRVSESETRKNELPKSLCFLKIYKYVIYLIKNNKNQRGIGSLLVSVFAPLIKIADFYDQRLKEIVGERLGELRCPGVYINRDSLIFQNSCKPNAGNQSSYFDENSLTFILLDWFFYFFSPDFQEQLSEGIIDISKLLARLTALIFILLGEPGKVNLLFSRKEFFESWIMDLEFKFEMEQEFQPKLSNFFEEIRDKTKDFCASFHRSGLFLRHKAARGEKLNFLNEIETILKDYFIQFYENGLHEYNRYLSNRML